MPKRGHTPRFSVWLESEGRYLIGKREAQILEGIRDLGSFMKTARALGVTYAHAWNTVNQVRGILGKEVVEARKGGRNGGGARLTRPGLRLLREYRRLEERVRETLPREAAKPPRKMLFEAGFASPDLAIIGSHCIGIEILVEMLAEESRFTCEVAHVGSAGGLTAIMLGEADIAGVHLLDAETGEYNVPFLRRYWLADKAVLVRGYLRRQGFITAKGNPKRIGAVEDLMKPGVRFINRELGSGTRMLLDSRIEEAARRMGVRPREVQAKIRGYGVEVRSHTDVAKAVGRGRADVGLGIQPVAEKFGLGFIPLAEESFDFVVEEKRLRKPLVASFIGKLGSQEFRARVEKRAPGITAVSETGRIVYRPS